MQFRQLALLPLLALCTLCVYAAPVPRSAAVEIKRDGLIQGVASWFEVGLGACGGTNTGSDFIVALPTDQYQSGAHCGKSITIINPANGNKQTAWVGDECPSCQYGHLDMSKGLFSALASGGLDQGMINDLQWWFDGN